MKYGHRQTLDPWQVKSSTGRNPNAWPLRVNDLREYRHAVGCVCKACTPEEAAA